MHGAVQGGLLVLGPHFYAEQDAVGKSCMHVIGM